MITQRSPMICPHCKGANNHAPGFDCRVGLYNSGNKVLFKLGPDAKQPTKGYPGDAGYDLYTSEEVLVEGVDKGRPSRDVKTGLWLALPDAYWAHIVARSSTFRRYGLFVLEAVIDNGYRGEMFIQVMNPSRAPVIIPKHTRIAQMILHKIYDVQWVKLVGRQELPESKRGEHGFGSSGR